jgi:hypothetical protein
MSKQTRKVAIDFESKVATAVVHSGDMSYIINMHFQDTAQLVRAAVEKCIIETNIDARAGKLKNGETYEVDCWGEIHKTDSQLVDEMSDSDIARMKALIAAKEARATATVTPKAMKKAA